jgi:hypothetical protein
MKGRSASVKEILRNIAVCAFVMMLLLPLSRPVFAAVPPAQQDSLRVVNERYFESIKKGDWEAAAKAMYPPELGRFKRLFIPTFRKLDQAGKLESIKPMFQKLSTIQDVFTLDSLSFFAQLFRGLTGVYPDIQRQMASSNMKFIGCIDEGPDTVHCICRTSLVNDSTAISKTQTNSFVRAGNGWGLLLTNNIEGLVRIFQRQ